MNVNRTNRAGFFVDIYSLQVSSVEPGHRLSYYRYLQHLKSLYNVTAAFAYTFPRENNVKFQDALDGIGYKTFFNMNYLVQMAVDMTTLVEAGHIETVVFGSNNFKLEPLLDLAQKKGLEVVFYCHRVTKPFAQRGKLLEIPQDCFYQLDKGASDASDAQPVELPPNRTVDSAGSAAWSDS